jgi:hypothetical protein
MESYRDICAGIGTNQSAHLHLDTDSPTTHRWKAIEPEKFREIIFQPEGYEAEIKASRGQNSLIEEKSVFV